MAKNSKCKGQPEKSVIYKTFSNLKRIHKNSKKQSSSLLGSTNMVVVNCGCCTTLKGEAEMKGRKLEKCC